jgi:hypothetical protein
VRRIPWSIFAAVIHLAKVVRNIKGAWCRRQSAARNIRRKRFCPSTDARLSCRAFDVEKWPECEVREPLLAV